MHVFPVALEVAVIEASVVSPAAAKSRAAISFPTIWIGMAATLLCVEHVVYQDAADARRHRSPPAKEVRATVEVHIVVGSVADRGPTDAAVTLPRDIRAVLAFHATHLAAGVVAAPHL